MGFPFSNRTDFKIRKGLDLPIGGRPEQTVFPGPPVSAVGLCTQDFAGLRLKPLVEAGDAVKLGQPLFRDRRHPEILLTSPGSGVVSALESGPRRTIRSVTVELEGNAEVEFPDLPEGDLSRLSPALIRERLLLSGLWTSLRMRPFGKIPSPDSKPEAIFVRAIDTNPLAADPAVIIERHRAFFEDGLRITGRLTKGTVHLCQRPRPRLIRGEVERLRVAYFRGPHPAGLVGTHIHLLHRVGAGRVVWYLDYQDTIAIGQLFRTGRLPKHRTIALGGPLVKNPRLLETRLGCDLLELLKDELSDSNGRVISGSVLSGRTAFAAERFLGRHHSQVSVIPEAGPKTSGNWLKGDRREYSLHRLLPGLQRFGKRFTTALHGPPSVIIPLGSFERVMPLDVLPTPLLRALAVEDVEQALALGCLELEEEDLALCTFLCPGKLEYGSLLRSVLRRIEKEI